MRSEMSAALSISVVFCLTELAFRRAHLMNSGLVTLTDLGRITGETPVC